MTCDHGCGWELLSQRAFHHSFFLGLQVEYAVFFRISDFTEGHPVDVGVIRGQQEEQQCGQAEGPCARRQSGLRKKRQATHSLEILSRSCLHSVPPFSLFLFSPGGHITRALLWTLLMPTKAESKISGYLAVRSLMVSYISILYIFPFLSYIQTSYIICAKTMPGTQR